MAPPITNINTNPFLDILIDALAPIVCTGSIVRGAQHCGEEGGEYAGRYAL